MPSFVPDENASILVEFDTTGAASPPAPELSARAINHAMNTMRSMAQQVADTMNTLDERPAQVEVSFGIQLNSDGQSAIVNIGRSAALSVKLTWQPPTPTPIELSRQRDRLWDELALEADLPPEVAPRGGWPAGERAEGRGPWGNADPYGEEAEDDYDEGPWQEGTPAWEGEEEEEDWGEEEYGYDTYEDYDDPPSERRGGFGNWR
jgi:hypothetical protein